MSARTASNSVRGRGAIRAVLLTALFSLALSAPAQAEEVPNHEFLNTLIGGLTPEPKPLKAVLENPCGVSVQPEGAIWVSDYYRQKIFNTTLPNFYPDNGPCGLASDGTNLYVNYWHGGIVNPDLGVIDKGPATGVAVDPATNDLYVAHRTSIAVYDAPIFSGDTPSKVIGAGGSLGDAYGVAVSVFSGTPGEVYVGDASDNTVKVYDPAVSMATPVRVMDGAGTAAGRFVSLTDASLALDQSNGHLFVADNIQPGADHPQMAINEFNAEGLYRGQLEKTIVDGEPVGIAVDESVTENYGQVYVTTGNAASAVFPADDGPPLAEQGALYAFGVSGEGQTLAVTRTGAGQGSVKSSVPGIACPGACKAELNSGATVVLTATPAAGSAFAGWSGACSGSGTCQVTLTAATSASAEFVPAPALAARTAATPATQAGPPAPAQDPGTLTLGRPAARGPATAIVSATAPGPGTLTATSKGLEASTSAFTGPATHRLRLHLNRSGLHALAKSKYGRLRLSVAFSFTPSGGPSSGVIKKTITFEQTS